MAAAKATELGLMCESAMHREMEFAERQSFESFDAIRRSSCVSILMPLAQRSPARISQGAIDFASTCQSLAKDGHKVQNPALAETI